MSAVRTGLMEEAPSSWTGLREEAPPEVDPDPPQQSRIRRIISHALTRAPRYKDVSLPEGFEEWHEDDPAHSEDPGESETTPAAPSSMLRRFMKSTGDALGTAASSAWRAVGTAAEATVVRSAPYIAGLISHFLGPAWKSAAEHIMVNVRTFDEGSTSVTRVDLLVKEFVDRLVTALVAEAGENVKRGVVPFTASGHEARSKLLDPEVAPMTLATTMATALTGVLTRDGRAPLPPALQEVPTADVQLAVTQECMEIVRAVSRAGVIAQLIASYEPSCDDAELCKLCDDVRKEKLKKIQKLANVLAEQVPDVVMAARLRTPECTLADLEAAIRDSYRCAMP